MNKQIFLGVAWRLTPAFLAFSWWRLANMLWDPLGCTGDIKRISGCSWIGYGLTDFVAGGLFLGYILWLPLLLLGVWSAGMYLQKNLRIQGQPILAFNYREAYALSLKSMLIWLVVSGVGASTVLAALYPNKPASLIQWACLFVIWVPLWTICSWASEKVKKYA